jgi:UDPglucose 6-dehydrogenase
MDFWYGKGDTSIMNICVIGAGYVGLTTSAVLAEMGHHTVCVDKLESRIESLSNGDIPIYEPGLRELVVNKKNNLTFTTDLKEAVKISDVIMIAVGTPSLEEGSTDLQFIHSVIHDLSEIIDSYKTIVTKSTVPPGTNEMIVQFLLQKGIERSLFHVVSNPEFLREGSAVYDMFHPDRTVVGLEDNDTKSLKIIKDLYRDIAAPYIVTSLTGAEIIKYASNAFLATKISFINEISTICDQFGVNIQSVSEGIGADKRIGNHFLQAGIGYGGSCFPKDLKSLQYEANKRGIVTHLLDAVQHINSSLIDVYVKKLSQAVPNLSNKKITVLGIAFKPDTDDTRHSPAVELMQTLTCLGCDVHAYDPKATLPSPKELNIIQHSELLEAIKDADCVAIATDWDEFKTLDWNEIKPLMRGKTVLDGRNILNKAQMEQLGFQYIGVGRG